MTRQPWKAKPKRYSPADTVHAIARMMAAPRPGGIALACPDEIRRVRGTGAPGDVVEVVLPTTDTLQPVRRWVEALDQRKTLTVTLTGGWGNGDLRVRADGYIPRGPRILVTAWTDGVRLAEPLAHEQDRVITVARLRELELSGGR